MLPLAALKFPETKGLSLEEVAALFNDEVVLDLAHLSDEQREALDAKVAETTDLTGIANLSLEKGGATERKEAVDDVERLS